MNKNNKKTPNALLIGAQKSGTTSLFDWIAQHPQVLSSPAIKDFPFFWHDENYNKGIGELTKLLPERGNEAIVLAGNVNDMFFEQATIRIKDLDPKMKLIVCLRNPIDRAYSAYNYAIQRGLESRSFAEAVKQELEGREPNDLISLSQRYYVSHGYYWKQLQVILKCFKREQVCVVLFEDIKHDSNSVMRELYHFLSVDESFMPNLNIKNETKGGTRSGRINALLFKYVLEKPFWYRVIRGLIPSNLRFVIRSSVDRVNRKKVPVQPIDPKEVELLKKHYQDGIEGLGALIERDLGYWLK